MKKKNVMMIAMMFSVFTTATALTDVYKRQLQKSGIYLLNRLSSCLKKPMFLDI